MAGRDEAFTICSGVWEVFFEVFQQVERHQGDGTYTGTSALLELREQLEEQLVYGPEEV